MKKASISGMVGKMHLTGLRTQLGDFVNWAFFENMYYSTIPGLLGVAIYIAIVFLAGKFCPFLIPGIDAYEYMLGCIVLAHLSWIMLVGGYGLYKGLNLFTVLLAIIGVVVALAAMPLVAGGVNMLVMILLVGIQLGVFILPRNAFQEQGQYASRRIVAFGLLPLLALWIYVASHSVLVYEQY